MDRPFLSLLYPTEASAELHRASENLPRIDEDTAEQLGLSALLPLKSCALSDFFTADPEVILYRQRTFADLLRYPTAVATLSRVLPILCDIRELRALESAGGDSGDAYLYSMTEIELYVSCIDLLAEGLTDDGDRFESPALTTLYKTVRELAESDYYRELNEKLNALSSRVREVRSITVGVNLDEQLRPVEAGVLSVNGETFKSGKLLDKILRMSFKNDAFTCIAALAPFGGRGQSENREAALNSAFHGALAEVFRDSVKGWRAIVGDYVLSNTDFLLSILPEIEFVTRAIAYLEHLTALGKDYVFPTLAAPEEKAFAATGLYNPDVALRIDGPVVDNDFAFDDDARIYILTGPNRGGKSVITCAVGIAQALCQLGLPVPAKSATLSPADGIFVHFPDGADDTIDKGRLGEECARLREIFDALTENSLVLLDESLSSTGAYEAAYIAAELLASFGALGVRGIFSTHLHELAASTDAINEKSASRGGVRIDNLVAGIEEGLRSFLILRRKPDGRSYAGDIADKYGLSFEKLTNKEN